MLNLKQKQLKKIQNLYQDNALLFTQKTLAEEGGFLQLHRIDEAVKINMSNKSDLETGYFDEINGDSYKEIRDYIGNIT